MEWYRRWHLFLENTGTNYLCGHIDECFVTQNCTVEGVSKRTANNTGMCQRECGANYIHESPG